jgi:hypothetical protein
MSLISKAFAPDGILARDNSQMKLQMKRGSSGKAQPPGQRNGLGEWGRNAHGHGAMSE